MESMATLHHLHVVVASSSSSSVVRRPLRARDDDG
jgi:hypothetical protein